MEVHLEIERTYEVDEGASVPDLARLPGVATVEPAAALELTSVYFDTPGQQLIRAGVTLRRRTGGEDEGWHLKLPVGADDREELREPLRGRATSVPPALRSLVQVHARGRKLAPVATVHTRRSTHRLLAGDGTTLAELCDDEVTATTPGDDGDTTTSWREWELELVHGRRKLLPAVEEELIGAGARPSTVRSKVARALGAPGVGSVRASDTPPSEQGPAGAVLVSHLRDQIHKLTALDPQVRRDEPDALHKMRVATRRLRSALATFKPLLDPGRSDELRAELRWLAGVLGGARDAEVMRDRLTTMAAQDAFAAVPSPGPRSSPGSSSSAGPGDAATGEDAVGDLAQELQARHRAAHDQVLRALNSVRYFRVLDSLDAVLAAPPQRPAAHKAAGKVLPGLVRRDWRRVATRAAAVDGAPTPADRDVELHELRKAAKRLRYACEALTPTFGAHAGDLGDAAKQLQEVLGEHQDSVVSRELLRELAGRGRWSGDVALVLGRLHLLEEEHAEGSRAEYQAAWDRVSDNRLRRWLRP